MCCYFLLNHTGMQSSPLQPKSADIKGFSVRGDYTWHSPNIYAPSLELLLVSAFDLERNSQSHLSSERETVSVNSGHILVQMLTFDLV